MAARSSYMNDWSTARICIRLAFTLTAVLGLWVSAFRGDLRWEILCAAYFVVQNVEHAAEKAIYELRRR